MRWIERKQIALQTAAGARSHFYATSTRAEKGGLSCADFDSWEGEKENQQAKRRKNSMEFTDLANKAGFSAASASATGDDAPNPKVKAKGSRKGSPEGT